MPRGVYERTATARAAISAALRGHVLSVKGRAKLSVSHTGLASSIRTRTKIAEGVARARANGAYQQDGPTDLELALRKLLQTAGFEFEEQVHFGRYVVDAWVLSYRLVFEADGHPWHT